MVKALLQGDDVFPPLHARLHIDVAIPHGKRRPKFE